jgi:hypothetical protein
MRKDEGKEPRGKEDKAKDKEWRRLNGVEVCRVGIRN